MHITARITFIHVHTILFVIILVITDRIELHSVLLSLLKKPLKIFGEHEKSLQMTSWWRVICRVFEHPKKLRRTKFWKRARTFCNLHPCYNFALALHEKHLFSADQEGVIFSCALLPMQYTIDFWPIGQLGVIRYFLKSISHVEIECEWCNFYSKNLLVVQILFTRQVRVL